MKTQFSIRFFIAFLGILFSTIAFADHEGDARNWVKKSQSIKGSWTIEKRDDGDYLVLSDDFKTRKGPDLKLMLSTLSSDDVNGKNASDNSLTIAPLASNKGSQSYKLPEGYADYSTLLIHCEKFSKLWGASNVKQHGDQ